MWFRDPVATRLGNDVASIIYRMIFRWKIDVVNTDYNTNTSILPNGAITFCLRLFNYRIGGSRYFFSFDEYRNRIHSRSGVVGIVPLNY